MSSWGWRTLATVFSSLCLRWDGGGGGAWDEGGLVSSRSYTVRANGLKKLTPDVISSWKQRKGWNKKERLLRDSSTDWRWGWQRNKRNGKGKVIYIGCLCPLLSLLGQKTGDTHFLLHPGQQIKIEKKFAYPTQSLTNTPPSTSQHHGHVALSLFLCSLLIYLGKKKYNHENQQKRVEKRKKACGGGCSLASNVFG